MLWTVAEHLGPVCMMLAIIGGNRAFARFAQERRSRGDAQKLRSALVISLRALRKLYRDNLGILAGGNPPLIAGRNQINLLRGQFSRLTCLEQSEVEAVWAAGVAAEAAETAMGVAGKPLGACAFTPPEQGENKAMLQSALRQARAALAAAEELLAPGTITRGERVTADATVIPFAAHALRSKRREFSGVRAPERSSAGAP
jgi:hypothetical protein